MGSALIWIAIGILILLVYKALIQSSREKHARKLNTEVSLRERHRAATARQRAAHLEQDAIIRRRLEMDEAHVHDGGAAVTIKATSNGRRSYYGTIITATGKELWRCARPHRMGRHGPRDVDPGILAARRCAQAELDRDPIGYRERAGQVIGVGSGSKRPSIATEGFEDWDGLRTAFASRCAYCGKFDTHLHQDHVIPLAKGGAHDYSNVLPACQRCNLSKGTKNLAEFLEGASGSGISLASWWPAKYLGGTHKGERSAPKAPVNPVSVSKPMPHNPGTPLPRLDLAPQAQVCDKYIKRGDGHCRMCGNHWYDHNKS